MSAGQIAAAAVAALIAAFAVWRWRRLELERRLGLLLVAVALAVYATGVLSDLPDPKELIGDIAEALGAWTYALVGVMAFLETGAFVGLVAPGETVVIAGGVIAGQGEIDLLPLIGLVWIAAVLGDTTSFFIGRRLGRAFLERHGPRVKITHERLEQVEGYFHRHGGKTILIGRFIGLVRALAPFIAGASAMPYGRFIPYSIVGTGIWSTVFCVLGYIFWRSFDRVAHIAGQAVFGFGLTVALIVAIVVVYRRRAEIHDWLLARQANPMIRPLFVIGRPLYRVVVRPLARLLRPAVSFVVDRLMPGELGLKLTTAMAVAGGGIYVFVLYAAILSGSTSLTPLDRELLDVGRDLRSETLVDIAKIVSDFGSFASVTAMLLVVAVALLARRRPLDAALLLFGFAVVYVAVDVTKAAIDRPRPSGPLVDTGASAYPSGHAAYATAWVAAAWALTRDRGLPSQAAIVTGAVALAVAIGLSRVYLRAHYWSDVAGGWGLGAGVFGLLAVAVLVVEYVRNNDRGAAPSAARSP
ncbi:MAG TPA: VTT domain-containing protein [Thermoleophilaceae bacterium]|nr:VTT domain-containing protein [Thermoleophilaceae bacterium]